MDCASSFCIIANAQCAVFRHSRPPRQVNCLVLTTCLPHKDGGILLSDLLKDTTSELADLFSTLSVKYFCRSLLLSLWNLLCLMVHFSDAVVNA